MDPWASKALSDRLLLDIPRDSRSPLPGIGIAHLRGADRWDEMAEPGLFTSTWAPALTLTARH